MAAVVVNLQKIIAKEEAGNEHLSWLAEIGQIFHVLRYTGYICSFC
jgi:hypothetical protein